MEYEEKNWILNGDLNKVFVGTSSENIIKDFKIAVHGEKESLSAIPEWYKYLNGKPSVGDFENLSKIKVTPYDIKK
uniref:CAZy families GH3 protein n=1 Tax=uncultured Lactobacillus sp. TaxID=153152 RepID=A0A060CEQ4_9LACO|nr:CAZy families GH3 protein [uncultured Lactobacillus sp.]